MATQGASTSNATHDDQAARVHAHRRAKKSTDPFLTRSLTAEVGAQFRPESPPNSADDGGGDDKSGSLLADLTITPLMTMLNFTSFIVSLVLVDRQQRQWRLSQHGQGSTAAGWSRAWLDPEPYQASSTSGGQDGRPASQKGQANTYSGWYTRKKKRAMARMEISDALEMKKRVVAALLVWTAVVLWAVMHLLMAVYRWVRGT